MHHVTASRVTHLSPTATHASYTSPSRHRKIHHVLASPSSVSPCFTKSDGLSPSWKRVGQQRLIHSKARQAIGHVHHRRRHCNHNTNSAVKRESFLRFSPLLIHTRSFCFCIPFLDDDEVSSSNLLFSLSVPAFTMHFIPASSGLGITQGSQRPSNCQISKDCER